MKVGVEPIMKVGVRLPDFLQHLHVQAELGGGQSEYIHTVDLPNNIHVFMSFVYFSNFHQRFL